MFFFSKVIKNEYLNTNIKKTDFEDEKIKCLKLKLPEKSCVLCFCDCLFCDLN